MTDTPQETKVTKTDIKAGRPIAKHPLFLLAAAAFMVGYVALGMADRFAQDRRDYLTGIADGIDKLHPRLVCDSNGNVIASSAARNCSTDGALLFVTGPRYRVFKVAYGNAAPLLAFNRGEDVELPEEPMKSQVLWEILSIVRNQG